MRSRRRRKNHAEHENLERWLVSYADFITLLFAFFTTMYAISSVDAQKMGRMVLSMQAAFDTSIFPAGNSKLNLSDTGSAPAPPNNALYSSMVKSMGENQSQLAEIKQSTKEAGQREDLGRIQKDLSSLIVDDALRDKVKIMIKNRGVVVSLAEAGFFDSGSDRVKPQSLPLLDKIAVYLKSLPNFIRVEGHTDNMPIHNARFPSNWELSTARATFIVSHLLSRHQFDPVKLSAAGYGEHHPADTNQTAEGRSRNRRVDVVILTWSAMQQEPETSLPPGRPE